MFVRSGATTQYSENLKKEWNVEQFDIIMGNPPYNDGSGNKGKGHTLWIKFVDCAMKKWLKKKGYVVFIHPSLWRQIGNHLLELIKSKPTLYCSLISSNISFCCKLPSL